MKVTKQHFEKAVQENIISSDQAKNLQVFFQSLPTTGPTFSFTHILYYLGGLIAIGAMSLFMNLGWESFGGWGIFFISLAYAGVGLKLAQHFESKKLPIPAGICATFAVVMTPLAIYGVQQATGIWPSDSEYREYFRYIRWNWIYMEMGTLAMGAMIAYRFRYPFLLMPIAVTLWFLSMDLAAMLAGGRPDFELRTLVSMYFGLAMTLLAFWVDIRAIKSGDYAFWLYLFGVMTFWCGLTMQESDSEIAKFFYFCTNIGLILIGAILVRKVFVVFGALGCAVYLGHLSYKVFKDSWLFPIVLSAIGLGIIYLGILWQKHETKITRKTLSLLPISAQNFLTRHHSKI